MKSPDPIGPGKGRLSRQLPLAAILLLAAGLRIALTLEHFRSPLFTFLRLDEIVYDEWAKSVMTGTFFLDYVPNHSPGYPWVLGLLYRLFGYDLGVPRLFQIALGLGSIALVHRIARALFGEAAALCSALVFGLYWPLLIFEQRVLATPLFLFLNLAGLLAAMRAASKNSLPAWAATGLLLGASAIVYPTSLFWIGMLLAWSLHSFHAKGPAIARPLLAAGVLAVAAALPLVPVIVHNHAISGEWLVVQMNGGLNLYLGNNPQADGTPYARAGGVWDALQALPVIAAGQIQPAAQDRFYSRQVGKFFRDDPGRAFSLLARKLGLLLNRREIRATYDPEFQRGLFRILGLPGPGFALVLGLALPGLLAIRLQHLDHQLLVLCAASYGLALVMTVVASRYRLPFTAALTILAGAGFMQIVSSLRFWRERTRSHPLFSWRQVVAPLTLLAAGVGLAYLPVAPAYTTAEELSYLGEAWMAKGQPDRALGSYRQALREEKTNAQAMMGMARLEFDQGNMDATIEWLRQAVAADPKSSRAHLQLGLLLWNQGHQEDGIRELERGVACRPLWVHGLYELAAHELALGRTASARDHLQLILRLRPDFAEAREMLSSLNSPAPPVSKPPTELPP